VAPQTRQSGSLTVHLPFDSAVIVIGEICSFGKVAVLATIALDVAVVVADAEIAAAETLTSASPPASGRD
jgi:hypothetical protein